MYPLGYWKSVWIQNGLTGIVEVITLSLLSQPNLPCRFEERKNGIMVPIYGILSSMKIGSDTNVNRCAWSSLAQ